MQTIVKEKPTFGKLKNDKTITVIDGMAYGIRVWIYLLPYHRANEKSYCKNLSQISRNKNGHIFCQKLSKIRKKQAIEGR